MAVKPSFFLPSVIARTGGLSLASCFDWSLTGQPRAPKLIPADTAFRFGRLVAKIHIQTT